MTDQELIAGLRKLAVAMTEAGYTVWRGVRPADVNDAADRLELLTDAQRLRELVETQADELARLRKSQGEYISRCTSQAEELARVARIHRTALSHLQTI
jgi:hypothetical protein